MTLAGCEMQRGPTAGKELHVTVQPFQMKYGHA